MVQTTQQAKAVLEWLAATPQKQQCRIWPVNALTTNADQLARQRAAQSQFTKGDYLSITPNHVRPEQRQCADVGNLRS